MSVALVRVPGDKSISHRALILATLARGRSRLRGLLAAEDTESTAAALRALGAPVPALPPDGGVVLLDGVGLRGLAPPPDVLDCGNSGTTARLLLGLLAAQPFTAVVTGDASLRARPMRRVTAPLAVAGARFHELGEPDRLPVRVSGGRLRPIHHESPVASAQVKSALLLAAVAAGVPAHVAEPAPSRDHTERMLRAMGADLATRPAENGAVVTLEPPAFLEPLDLRVPGDFSTAAYFLALGLLWPGAEQAAPPARETGLCLPWTGVNPTRTGLLTVLERMGATILQNELCEVCGEPVAELVVRPAELKGTDVAPAEVPALLDEVPVLAILAARARGVTRISGAGELRVKESDRIRALVTNLRALGVGVEEREDGFLVRGGSGALAGRVGAFGDHRIAMAFGVLGALPGNRIEVDHPDVAAVSHPGFWSELARASAALERR